MPDVDYVARLREVGEKATAGPWFWNVNLKSRQMQLEAQIAGYETVMDFVRWGMGGAQARFKVETKPGLGLMHKAETMTKAVPGREHHADWYQTIEHPDALHALRAAVEKEQS